MTSRWPIRDWSWTRLAERCGDCEVALSRYRPRDHAFLEQTTRERRTMDLGAWIAELTQPTSDETSEWCLRESQAPFQTTPALRFDLDFRGVFPRGHPEFRHLMWAGPAGYVTGLHTDELALNLLAHVLGRKRVVMYGPEQESKLYPTTREAVDGGRYSNVNPVSPDRERHPAFAEAAGIEVILEPGDLLYIPRTYWHWAESLTPSLSISGVSQNT